MCASVKQCLSVWRCIRDQRRWRTTPVRCSSAEQGSALACRCLLLLARFWCSAIFNTGNVPEGRRRQACRWRPRRWRMSGRRRRRIPPAAACTATARCCFTPELVQNPLAAQMALTILGQSLYLACQQAMPWQPHSQSGCSHSRSALGSHAKNAESATFLPSLALVVKCCACSKHNF